MEIPDDILKTCAELFALYDPPSFDEVAAAILAERERCAKICEQQAQEFLSPQYASNQPLGSLCERFACDECAAAIRTPSTDRET